MRYRGVFGVVFALPLCACAPADDAEEYTAEDAVNDYGDYICDLLDAGENLASIKLRMADTGEADIVEANAIVNASVERHCPEYGVAAQAPTYYSDEPAPTYVPPEPEPVPTCRDLWRGHSAFYELGDDAQDYDPDGAQQLFPRVTIINGRAMKVTISVYGRGRATTEFEDLPLDMSWDEEISVKPGGRSVVDVGPDIGMTLFVAEGQTYEILEMTATLRDERWHPEGCRRKMDLHP